MATTTTSNRKKPTPKTKAAKTQKKTKASVVSPAKVSVGLGPLERVRSLHLTKVIIYLLGLGLVLGFVKTAASAVTLGVMARDEFASGENVVLTPAYEVLFNLEPRYLLVASLGFAALTSLLLATKWRNRYESTLTAKISGFRWVGVGISGALMLGFVSLLAGVHDVTTLKLSTGLVLFAAILSWLSERESVGSKPHWLTYAFAVWVGVLAWLPLVGSLIGTTLYSDERFGWHIYAFAGVVLAGFLGIALNQYRYLKNGQTKPYPEVEEAYLRMDLLSKFAVVLIALLALK